jgi:hypothetical protein
VKKAARILARIVIALIVLIAIAAVACLDCVDYRPYFRQSYYQTTIARLEAAAKTNTLARGDLQVGFGTVKLAPPFPVALAGYGSRKGQLAAKVHDDVFVKAVAIRVGGRTAIMFGCDALIVPREVADEFAFNGNLKSYGQFVSRSHLYFSATHTHCSIGGWGQGMVGEAFAGKFDGRAGVWFAGCAMRAAGEALKDLKPAEFGHGSFFAPQFIRNRLVGELGKVDPEFSYAIFKQANGRTGVIGSFSAHATVLSGSMMEYSSDYPGEWQRAVEKATGGFAMFVAGGVGSQGPVAGAGGFEGVQKMGGGLAAEFLKHLLNTPMTNRIAFGALAVNVAMPELNERLTDGIRLRPWVTRQLLPPLQDSFIQAFRLGDMIWISTPCDYSGELALGIKETLRARGFSGVVTSFNGDYVGYVIPSRYYHLSGYEPRLMSFYGPCVPDYLDELARTIALDLVKLN